MKNVEEKCICEIHTGYSVSRKLDRTVYVDKCPPNDDLPLRCNEKVTNMKDHQGARITRIESLISTASCTFDLSEFICHKEKIP
jgi:hypothetical protein